MASFARLIPGEWQQPAASGTSMYHTWHWGPGKHSIRRMTDGAGAGGQPWRDVQVFYWHPGRKRICLLGVSPYARGVSEGTITFDGDTASAVIDLYQTGRRRKMGLRWAFDGPNKYHETLLEQTGPAGFKPLVEFDLIRSRTPAAPRPPAAEKAPKPSERLTSLEPLLGHTWEATGDGDAVPTRSSFEWVPLADMIYTRVLAPTKDGEPTHWLDAYLYHHTGADALRCLALSDRGGVYEGDVTALVGGAVQLDLTGTEGDRTTRHVARIDFETGGTLRQRVWSVTGVERTLVLDIRHAKVEPKKH